MELKGYKCNKCGFSDFYAVQKGNNTGIYCCQCGAWLKWANKAEKNLFLSAQNQGTPRTSPNEYKCDSCDIDKAAHRIFKFEPPECVGRTEFNEYSAFYHEDRLYSVKDKKNKVTYLLEAKNPYEAIQKITGINPLLL